jgi:membrane-bound lytic murein transglycosylase D
MNINILTHLILFFLFTNSIFSIEPEDSLKNSTKKNTSKEIDSLVINQYKYFNNSPETKVKIDTFTSANDLVYEYRIAKFNIDAKIDIDFNEDVKKFIEMYTVRKKDEMALILARSEIYFPIYEEYLDKYGLPLELKYLSVIESGLNPNARSRSGAVGLWQFMYNTGKMLDLEIDNYIDDRKDPYKSTEAACKYLNYLYNTFNNWELAIAAYNGGPGTVRNAIIKAGGEQDFWKIKKYLPKQTQDYVPIYLAAIYSFTYYNEHNITPKKLDYNYYNTDTLSVRGDLSLYKVADAIGLPYEDIIFLNPRFKNAYIPNNKTTYSIVLPSYKISDFISSTNYLNKNNLDNKDETYIKPKYKVIHTVEEGEYFHKIAINYGCTIENIMEWNNLDTNKVHSGQKLIIYTSIEGVVN